MSDDQEASGAPARARTLSVKQFIDPDQLKKDLSYSLADLSSAMVTQGSMFVHYGTLASKASRQVDNVKMLLEVTEAKVYRRLRDDAAKAGTKMSEAQLEKAVATHKRVIDTKIALNEAKQIEATAKTAVEGFRHRRDMLIQLGLIEREQMKGEVSINRRKEADDAADEQRTRVMDKLARRYAESVQ